MAIKGKSLTVNYFAYNSSDGAGETGDKANHTLKLIKDGGSPSSPSNSISEPDSTNMPGTYEIKLTASEMDADYIYLHGSSSTSNVVIFPVPISTDQGQLVGLGPSQDFVVGRLNEGNSFIRLREQDPIELFLGEVRTLNLRVVNEKGEPLNMVTSGNNPSDITVKFPDSGTKVEKTLSGGGVTEEKFERGEFKVDLDSNDTNNLKTGKGQNIIAEIELDNGDKRTAKFEDLLNVEDSAP